MWFWPYHAWNASIISWECINMVTRLVCTISGRFYLVSCSVFRYTQKEQLGQVIVCCGIFSLHVSLARSDFALNWHTLFKQLITVPRAPFGSLATTGWFEKTKCKWSGSTVQFFTYIPFCFSNHLMEAKMRKRHNGKICIYDFNNLQIHKTY